MYEKVCITDVKEFYNNKFAVRREFDFTRNKIEYYEVDNFKLFWYYSNVKSGSKVLDFGCGSGTLAGLKRKGCELTGIDYSEEALSYAKKMNGYDNTVSVDIFDYDNFGYFDYIISSDVFGHIPFKDKDAEIKQLKKFLKPGGSMLHGIERGPIDISHLDCTCR